MNQCADTNQIKAELAANIVRLLAERALTDAAASEQIGLPPADIALIREGYVDRRP